MLENRALPASQHRIYTHIYMLIYMGVQRIKRTLDWLRAGKSGSGAILTVGNTATVCLRPCFLFVEMPGSV